MVGEDIGDGAARGERRTALSWLARIFARAPSEPAYGDAAEVAAVEAALAEERGAFRSDGGDVELVGVRDGWVEVRLSGACTGCSAQAESVEAGLAPRLRARLPWVRGVRRAPGS
jgi:Fe-S cluster biogenesis protein NfuA